ncbi:MAG TPA: FtsQ-type POTRA domain-containing protein [Pseudonocardia sp.]|jgi:cell division protein FtsQ|uniref:cell division protein FtsQ/DivIB n=1 Tax=Pseudonocardia sp. TaxID=60912 RepID=UPI002F40DDC2
MSRGGGLTAERPAGSRVPSRRPAPGGARFRRRRRLALAVLLLVLAAAALVGGRAALLHLAKFRVSEVDVQASADLDPGTLRELSGLRTGVPLLTVDLDAAQRRVAAVPRVASVLASRDWPSTVTLRVTERTPVALTDSANGPWLVDATGMAYQPAPKPPPALPKLRAGRVAAGDPATAAALSVLSSLTPELRQRLRAVEAGGPFDVRLRLADGKQVLWGSAENSPRKAAVLAVLLTQPGSSYDVSAPDLPTIRR